MKLRSALLMLLLLTLTTAAVGQNESSQAGQAQSTPSQTPPTQAGQPAAKAPEEPSAGKEVGGYLVHQSIELGGRITDKFGSTPMYNTLVNLQSGPRVLEQTLSMQATTQTGNLFDNLYASSFGWGGDPSNAARLRISKLAWYDFTASFRRDKNYFDYDLFANPLNSPAAPPSTVPVPIVTSPHDYYTTRRMYDFALKLLPQRRVSFRVGYFRNRSEGPSFSTMHIGTEALLDQGWNNTLNGLQFGFDARLLPRTTLSFTENLQWVKVDTDYGLVPFNPIQLAISGTVPTPSGIIASYGLTPVGVSPTSACKTALVSPTLGNPSCSLYIGYTRNQRYRNFLPTEQLNLMSSSIRHLDLVVRGAYSTADVTDPMLEFFNGLESRTLNREYTANDFVKGRWVSASVDFGATYHLTRHVRLVDTFHFNNWRKPASLIEALMFFYNAASAAGANAALPVAMFPTLLQHNGSSEADLTTGTISRFLKNEVKSNQIELQLDTSRFVGFRAGYRYRHRMIADQELQNTLATYYPVFPATGPCAGMPAGPCTVPTVTSGDEAELSSLDFPEHTGIAGLWIRPTDKMHFNFDAELTSSGDIITRISPRHQQQYRADFSYTPKQWVTFGANFNLLERWNHTATVEFGGHSRNIGFNVTASPNDRIGVDLAYNYTGFEQNTLVCFVGTNTGVTGPACPPSDEGGPGLTQTLGYFNEPVHFGSIALRVKPTSRVSASVGYSVTDTDGSVLRLNALQPLGALSSRWQQPLAALGIGITKELFFNAGWNYYQYSERDFVGPTLPRYFHANIATLSLRYAF